MRTGLQTVLTALALGGILVAAGSVHLAWWQTATRNSTALAHEIERQVTASVRHEWWSQVTGAEAAYRAAARLIERDGSGPAIEAALLQPLGDMSLVSALVHVGRRGGIAAVEPDQPGQQPRLARFDRDWPRAGAPGPNWILLDADPVGGAPAVAYVGRLADGSHLGALVALSQFSRLLGRIAVGRSGGALIVDGAGRLVAGPSADSPVADRLAAVGQRLATLLTPGLAGSAQASERLIIDLAGARYVVALSPLHFRDWQFAIVIAEADFRAEIDTTNRNVGVGLALAILIAGALAAVLAHAILVRPIRAVTGDLAHLERFELAALTHRSSRLTEIDQLSAALARMAAALANFARYIPVDLVRDLVAHGERAEPGGRSARVTVMFADLAGFTGLAERLGPAVLPVASRFFEAASDAVEQRHGVVDKFIGDAVMALWGAPRHDTLSALHACQSALAISAAVRALPLDEAKGQGLAVRIGINSGEAIVGNIGSRTRLNYTAIGDSVNIASRLEGANKLFGTAILISAATRAEAGAAIVVRELDRIAVYGKTTGVAVYELVGLTDGTDRPGWIEDYEAALQAYRDRDFRRALGRLDSCLARKPGDAPALLLAERCEQLLVREPEADWHPVLVLETK
jgi:adenylate cyclase